MRREDWRAGGGTTAVSLTTAQYAGWCGCGSYVAVGDVAGFHRERRQLLCLDCFVPRDGYGSATDDQRRAAPPPGRPGGSSWRVYHRRQRNRRERVRERLPHLGRLALALTPQPAATRAWACSARGEERVAEALTALAGDWVYALHDRRIPGRRANIDHIAVAPSGVFVIDVKSYANAAVEVRGPSRRSPLVEQLLVAGQDRTDLVGATQRQVLTVHAALADLDLGDDLSGSRPPVLVQPMLCFVKGNLPLRGRLSVDNVPIVGLREMTRIVRRPGPLDVDTRYRIYAHLGGLLPSMT